MSTISKSTRELYRNLRLEVIGIHSRLRVLRQLYTSQEIVDLLDKTAYLFFNTLRNDLIDTIVLMANRLLDPAKTFNKYPNVSFQKLIDNLDPAAYPKLITSLKDILDTIKTKSKRLKNWRDKWVGHRDYDVLLGSASKPVISLMDIDEVLLWMGKFLNEFEDVCQDVPEINLYNNPLSADEINEIIRLRIKKPTPYENRPFLPGDGDTIIELIKKANSTKEKPNY